jgi:hypothetical protein
MSDVTNRRHERLFAATGDDTAALAVTLALRRCGTVPAVCMNCVHPRRGDRQRWLAPLCREPRSTSYGLPVAVSATCAWFRAPD